VAELVDRRIECAGRREGTDVQFVDDLASEPHAVPVGVVPSVGVVIDHHGRPVRPARLETGTGVRPGRTVVEPVPVQGAGANAAGKATEVPIWFGLQGNQSGAVPVAVLERHLDAARSRCPDTKMGSGVAGACAEERNILVHRRIGFGHGGVCTRSRSGANGRQPVCPGSACLVYVIVYDIYYVNSRTRMTEGMPALPASLIFFTPPHALCLGSSLPAVRRLPCGSH